MLSFDSTQPNESYTIEVSPSPAYTISFPTVTTTTDATRCPFTLDLQISDGTVYQDYVGNEGTYPWISSYTSNTGFEIQTDDAATYGNPTSLFNCRLVAIDPDSTSLSSAIT